MNSASLTPATASQPRPDGRPSQRYQTDTPRPEDDAAIATLLRLPMEGRVRLSLRRDPNRHQAAAIEGDLHYEVVVRERADGQVVGYGHRSVRTLWIEGKPRRVGYLGGLRAKPGVRLPRRLIGQAFDAMLSTRRPEETAFDLTSILADNHTARRGLERGVLGLPVYTPLGELITATFRVRRRRGGGRSTPPIAALSELHKRYNPQFNAMPCWSMDELPPLLKDEHFVAVGDPDAPVATAAVWDQRAAKQTIIDDLDPHLRRWRHLINVGLYGAGRPTLPEPGSVLSHGYVSHIACPPDRPDLLVSLLHAGSQRASEMGLKLLSVGLPNTDTYRAVARRLRGWVSRSVIYAVHAGSSPPPDVQAIRGGSCRPIWPEVALL